MVNSNRCSADTAVISGTNCIRITDYNTLNKVMLAYLVSVGARKSGDIRIKWITTNRADFFFFSGVLWFFFTWLAT